MNQLIAAIDDSAAARPVLMAASRVAQLFGDSLFALHVSDDVAGHTASDVAAALDIPLRVRHGEAVSEIASAASAAAVRGVVVGSRGLPNAGRAIGGTALALIQTLDKTVVVVPPTVTARSDRLHRLLVPLDGTGETAAAVQRFLEPVVADADLEVIALHVFESDSIPPFSDQPGHETEAWAREFLRRWSPTEAHKTTLEMRVGRAADVVRAIARDVHADMVALGWKQNLAPGRAAVVSALLADADVPIVLLPTVPSH
jgi:nucleotide-binding universal stress UspA family protein